MERKFDRKIKVARLLRGFGTSVRDHQVIFSAPFMLAPYSLGPGSCFHENKTAESWSWPVFTI